MSDLNKVDGREFAVKGIAKLGYPGLAKLVELKGIEGMAVLNGIKELYWKEHTVEEQAAIKELLCHCQFFEI